MRVSIPRLLPERLLMTVARKLPRIEAPAGGFLVVHPRYRAWLKKCGVEHAEDLFRLPGEIVCGHPDRHVAKVSLGRGHSQRFAYLKREHQVSWRTRIRNKLAGFGPVSRAEREAATLRTLEGAGLPGPQWLAYGEDACGRAALLVDELVGAVELREFLAEKPLSAADRCWLAEKAGRALAELHEAGFSTPELAAKHLFIHPDTLAVTLLDWQSAPLPRPLTSAERVRQLANLTASLAENLAGPRERLRFLWAYRRVVRDHQRHRNHSREPLPRFCTLVQAIRKSAQRRYGRSSLRDQRITRATPAQRLIWLAGEEVCVVPDMAGVWPEPAAGAPFYLSGQRQATTASSEWITFADGRRALLNRFSRYDPLGRFWAALRQKSWRSPGSRYARLLFHLERHGIDGPRLLAFGQRLHPGSRSDSFLVSEPVPGAIPLTEHLQTSEICLEERRALLREAGRMLRQLHDTGCRLRRKWAGNPLFVVTPEDPARLAVESPFALRLVRRVRSRVRRSDLNWLVTELLRGLSRTDRCRVLRGYAQREPGWKSWRQSLFAGAVSCR